LSWKEKKQNKKRRVKWNRRRRLKSTEKGSGDDLSSTMTSHYVFTYTTNVNKT
jgi:hypothetical protein